MDQILNYILAALGALFILIIVLFFKQKKGNVQVTKQTSGKWVLKAHRLYSSIPGIRKYYKKTYNMVYQMYPANDFSVTHKTVKTVTRGFAIFFGCILFVFIIARGDILFLLTGLLVSYVLMTTLVNGRIVKQETVLLEQFKSFLEVLRYYYNDCGKVDESIDRALAESPYELSLHMERIYNVVTDVDIDKATETYVSEPNNKFFLLFCSICSTITKQGDRPLPEGVTVFLNNIKHLQEELNVEILRKRLIKNAFSGVSAFCILPIFLLKPIELWASNNQAEMSQYYSGAYGTVIMFLIFILSVIGSAIIDNLKNGKISENVKLWERISEFKPFKIMINKEIAIHFAKAQKINTSLKRVGSSLTTVTFYTKKISYAIGFAVLINLVVFVSNWNEKNQLMNDFTNAFTTTYAVDTEYTQTLQDLAKRQMEYGLRNKNVSDEELTQNIIQNVMQETNIEKVSTANEIARVVVERRNEYKDVYYRWWILIISFIAAFIGFKIPELILNAQRKAMEMEMEDEIIQFQAIALIMMHIKESTVEDVLQWMERFSKCFKSSITRCIINLDAGEQQALEELRNAEPAPQFQKIVNSLMNVDKVGLESAFDSVETERKFMTEKRNEDNKIIIQKKAKKAWTITFGILFAVIGLWIIGPMLLMGTSMMSQLTQVMNSI